MGHQEVSVLVFSDEKVKGVEFWEKKHMEL